MSLLSHRVRGFRLVDLVALGLLIVLILGVYLAKTIAGRERTEIARVERQIDAERARIRLLQAEVSHLEQPSRIERLSSTYLGLQPVSIKREAQPEDLPIVSGKVTVEGPKVVEPKSPVEVAAAAAAKARAAAALLAADAPQPEAAAPTANVEAPAMSLGQDAFGRSLISRWISSAVWSFEHAFERARASGKVENDVRIRIFFVLAMFAAGFVTLAIGASRAAISDVGRGAQAAAPMGASRADLVDRNGQMLAADLLHYGLYIDPREIWDTDETRRALLRTMPKLEAVRLERALRASRRTFLVGALTPEVRARVHALGLPGVSFEPEQRRVYPLGVTGAHLIGFADSGGEGLSGAEAALNEQIRAGASGHQAVPLSIDLRVQAALEDELYKAAGEFTPKAAVGVVLNVHTGEILGMANYPTFDPNRAGEATDDARMNRAAATVYEMGSTFKAFTVAVGLDTGVATPTSTFDARNPYKLGYRTIHDYHAARKILTLVEVFQHSSNIGTAKLAVAIGPQRLSQAFTKLGLTSTAKVELIESARPLTPKVWNEDAVASTSFGHGMNVSALTLSRAMSALLNGGVLTPLTIRKQDPAWRPQGTRAVSERTSQQMLQIMRANVTGGSGGKADVPGLSVGGKTGTGEKYDPAIRAYNHKRQVSSFAAVFPTDGAINDDRYFVLILMDEPHATAATYGFSTGGWVAAPAAGRVIERIAPFLGVQRKADTLALAPPAPSGEAQ